MRYEIKSIGIWALIKISFFLNLVMGFITGVVYSFFLAAILSAGVMAICAFTDLILLPALLVRLRL